MPISFENVLAKTIVLARFTRISYLANWLDKPRYDSNRPSQNPVSFVRKQITGSDSSQVLRLNELESSTHHSIAKTQKSSSH